MPTKIEITCFTDLKGSTALTEQMGHHEFMPVLQAHLALGRSLATRNNGSYVKNIGDAHMVRFQEVENALAFAAQLQQLSCPRPGVIEIPISVRVSLFQGAVEPIGEDVFGSGVNQSARLQGLTEPEKVTVNEDLFKTMKVAFGAKAQQYCTSLGNHELKGIKGEQQLHSFEWQRYVEDIPSASLAHSLYSDLRRAGIELSNISEGDLNRPGQIIWPVVPRQLVTAIHRCQIELIRLLVLLGWEVVVLIADCGGAEYDDDYIETFQKAIEAHAALRKLRFAKVVRMSMLYEPAYAKYAQVQDLFRRISSRMSVKVLMEINMKGNRPEVLAEINGRPTLTHLLPPLTLASVLHLAEEHGPNKCAIIAGADERLQWGATYSVVPNGRTRVGVLMIPVVKMDPQYQVHQGKQWPIWYSEEELVRQMANGSNLGWWLFRLLAFLPAFPASTVTIGDNIMIPEQWPDELETPPNVDLARLVNHMWPVLNPNNG